MVAVYGLNKGEILRGDSGGAAVNIGVRGGLGAGATRIQLSSRSIAEDASVNDVIGTLSVSNGSGSYTFTITADPDSQFNISVANFRVGASLDYETKTSHSVTIQADNGVDDPITRMFTINVINVIEAPVWIVSPAVTGDATVGETVTCSQGLATDMDAGTYTYQWHDAADDSPLSGQTNPTFIAPPEFEGESAFCRVTATNSADSTSEDSNTVGPFDPGVGTIPNYLLWGSDRLVWGTDNGLVWGYT